MKKISLCSILLLSTALLTTGCRAGSNNFAAETTAAARETMAATENYAGEYGEEYAVEDYASEKSMTYDQAADTGEALSGGAGSMAALPQGRKLIRNVEMNVETNTFDELISALQLKISALGGYIEQSDISGNSLNYLGEPIPRYASITARIPSDKLGGFVTAVEESGNVTNKSECTQDVTLQYSDIESRKKSLLIEQDRIWALLEKAESLETVLSLEQRLSDIRYELESMESQLRLYDNQVEYSAVYLRVSEVTSLTTVAPETTGDKIKRGLAQNFTALANALTRLLIGVITTLPFWLPMLLIFLFVIHFARRHDRKKDSSAAKKEETKTGDGNE